MNNNGYIKLHRKIAEWEWYTDAPTKILFFHLLISANWTDGKFKGIVVKRGQLITTIRSLADQTGLTIQQIRTGIKRLKSTQEITQTATRDFTVITICNYSVYQDLENDINTSINTDSNKPITNQQHSINTDIRIKEYKKEINNLGGYENLNSSARFEQSFSNTYQEVLTLWKEKREEFGLGDALGQKTKDGALKISAAIDRNEITFEQLSISINNLLANKDAKNIYTLDGLWNNLENWSAPKKSLSKPRRRPEVF